MIVILNGPCGIGKTTVAWELNARFDRAVMLDGDYIGAVYPFEIYDKTRVAYLYRTLQHLVRFHIEQGDYHNFVINYVFEHPESLSRLCGLLGGLADPIRTVRLIASDKAIRQRICRRETGADRDWHLQRYRELVTIQERAAQRGDMGHPIDTTDRTAAQVAEAIWAWLAETQPVTP